jgi:hypothetical protein
MTTTTQPSWLDTLTGLIDDLRRLDLKLTNDTRLEPAPTDDPRQIDTTLISATRLTSRGELIAELELSGRIKWRYQQPAPAVAETGETRALNGGAPAPGVAG